ncbi:phosphoglycerate kinase [Nematocida displodere]|uniref:Phosphoglycerate kinase n=1 Tax=Nematocida displodere TaxID=1805483 RepID=A0A177EHG6_9MICR|nr:phosphoglycerate kinase [Nematocida displodere]
MRQWTHEVYAGKKTLGDIDLEGRRVFLRVDYNAPIQDGTVTDSTKLRRTLPTIKFLIKRGVQSIVIGTHLGRPEEDEDPVNSPSSGGVQVVLEELNRLLQSADEKAVFEFAFMSKDEGAQRGRWTMVQNLRTLKVERNKKDVASRELFDAFVKNNCDVMVSDGFGVLHRKDYSVVGLPLEKVAGLLVDSEVQGLSLLLGEAAPPEELSPLDTDPTTLKRFTENARTPDAFKTDPKKPIDLLIIGGCKLADKIGLVKSLAGVASNIFLGGLLSTPFDTGEVEHTSEIMESAARHGANIFLSADYLLESGETILPHKVTPQLVQSIRDIGPSTEDLLNTVISKSKRIFWNGTLGLAEQKKFAHGTETALKIIETRRRFLSRTGTPGMMAAGGGDTSSYIHLHNYAPSFDLIFTGGGATLEALEGKVLPGIEALADRI